MTTAIVLIAILIAVVLLACIVVGEAERSGGADTQAPTTSHDHSERYVANTMAKGIAATLLGIIIVTIGVAGGIILFLFMFLTASGD